MSTPGVLQAVPFTRVELTGGLWKELMDTNREQTLPVQYAQCRDTGRLEALKLRTKKGAAPHVFWDSDIAKWIEAAAYSLASHPDPALERKVDRAIRDIEKSQGDDGYFNSFYQQFCMEKRWQHLRGDHELYCAGHLMEAAVAYRQATGKRRLLDVVMRFADHIDRKFGPKKGQIHGYPGHEEIELGLVRLYEETGEQRYLKLAEYFVDERGQCGPRKPHYFQWEGEQQGEYPKGFDLTKVQYNQSHLPVREQKEIVGHAVRALYLYSGMTSVAMHRGDASLFKACKTIWKNLVTRRMAITGGVGPRAQNEGMSADYDLPAEGAYLETCAAIALVFWAHRMFLATGDGQYADVMERALYNGTISGRSRDGNHFFYGNPLAAHPGFDGNDAYQGKSFHYRREPWFWCACCPPNLARMIAQFPGYMYAVRGRTLFVNLYVAARADIEVGSTTVKLAQQTKYPWDGKVKLSVTPSEERAWTLALRVPDWCGAARVKINGKRVSGPVRKGFMQLKRTWSRGDVVELDLPMDVQQVAVNPKSRQGAGQVALQRGPLIYCLEQVDNGADLANLYLDERTRFNISKGPSSIGGVPVITADARGEDASGWGDQLYEPRARKLVRRQIRAIPYFLWANRKPGEMTVFVKRG